MKFVAFAVVAGLLPAGCSRGPERKEAVRQAVIDHLANNKGMNVGQMDVEVVPVSFRETEADATVSFRTRGAQGVPGIAMNYTLAKQGNAGRSRAGPNPATPPMGPWG